MDYTGDFARTQSYLDGLTSPLKHRHVCKLTDDWRFFAGACQAETADFDDTSWPLVQIPHDWSIEGEFSNRHPSSGSGGWVQTGIVWYRKSFDVPDASIGRKFSVLFDGVSMNSKVWINGHFLGNHAYGFTPFMYDLTPWIKPGGNVLAVSADTSLQPYSRFYHGTGIFRQVQLISTHALHIEQWGVTVKTRSIDQSRAILDLSTQIRVAAFADTVWHGFGHDPQKVDAKACILKSTIIDPSGRIVHETSQALTIAPYTQHTLTATISLEHPLCWSIDTPDLYQVRSELLLEGAVVDDQITPFGVRTIHWSADLGLLLNQKPVKLNGVCLHQDSGAWGGAVPAKVWIRKILTLKEMGCNAIRTSHHPFPTEFYHCCDRLGMLVMDEAFDEWKRGWERDFVEQPYGKNEYGYSLYFDQWHDADIRAMIRRDRNHPSVIMWSIGNEIPELYYPESVAITRKLAAICKEEDDTRPVTIGAEGQYRLPLQDDAMAQLDIPGYNYVNQKHDCYYQDIHLAHPEWTLVGTETFFDPEHVPAVKNQTSVIGQFLWVGYDYLGEAYDKTESVDPQTGTRRLMHGSTGMVDVLDAPRAEFFFRQSLWSDKPVVHLAVKTDEWVRAWWNQIKAVSHWNWQPGETKSIYCFTNCESIELILNDRSLGRREKDLDDPMPIVWDVPYEPGKIMLIGSNRGEVVCTHELETTGAASKLLLTCDSPSLVADGSDTAQVDIVAVDSQGRMVRNIDAAVNVTWSGAGQLLGLVSGDMHDAESYRGQQGVMRNGHCMANIRAGKTAGQAVLTVRVEGLPTAELAVEIVPTT